MEKEVEIMRIKRLPPMGKLVVEIGNKRYASLSQLPTDVLKQLVLAAVGELIVFADGYQTLVDAGVAPPIVGPALENNQGGDLPISEREAMFKAALEQERLAALTGDLVTPTPTPVIVQPAVPVEPGQLKDELDIAGQVNVFLQKQVQQTPELKGRSISIIGDSSGSLTIGVDGKGYRTPGEIEDPVVRRALQAALKEWEAGKRSS